MAQKRIRSTGSYRSAVPLVNGRTDNHPKENRTGGYSSGVHGVMIVQYVEILRLDLCLRFQYFQSSVSPLSSIVSPILRFYVVLIYIHHFKRPVNPVSGIALWFLKTIGIMTKPKRNDIRYFGPYLL